MLAGKKENAFKSHEQQHQGCRRQGGYVTNADLSFNIIVVLLRHTGLLFEGNSFIMAESILLLSGLIQRRSVSSASLCNSFPRLSPCGTPVIFSEPPVF